MAKASISLVSNLRDAAQRLEEGAEYNWGNATKCNCAHLVRCLEPETAAQSFAGIRDNQLDEWTEYAKDYCPVSGRATDQAIDVLYAHGFSYKDVVHLEYLSDRTVLEALPGGLRYLQRGQRRDVALYMRTWASLLEQQLPDRAVAAPRLQTAAMATV